MSFLDFGDESPKIEKKIPKPTKPAKVERVQEIRQIVVEPTPVTIPVPRAKPAYDGCSDELKLIYHIVTGATSHTTKIHMIEEIMAWLEGLQ